MAADSSKDSSDSKAPEREACVSQHSLPLPGGGALAYTARADWMVLREKEEPVAELFHVAYTADDADGACRPVTFVFNGGPGAASAYLHVGALGPRRIAFPDDGSLPPSPVKMVDNTSSWLRFTDLVFIDPVGTGFSRTLNDREKDKDGKPVADADKKRKAFWSVDRDLQALGEFIRRFLTRHRRWSSPAFIAGESYGGFRVARLLKELQERCGVGLCGAVLISPALDFAALSGSDYDLLAWIDRLPTMAAAAHVHGLVDGDVSLADHLAEAERFARRELSVALLSGAAMPAAEQQEIFDRMARLTGLDPALVARCGGRVAFPRYCRELLREQGRVLGMYDASVSTTDPFPDRPHYEGPDPTLAGLDRLFVAGIYQQLRDSLGVEEEIRDYQLLSYDVFLSWRYNSDGKQNQGKVGASDELRYGMSLNRDVRVFICHGYYDLVTPYFASNRAVDLMRLPEDARARLTLQHFEGGHMFYTWRKSREDFFDAAQTFYTQATAHLDG